MRAFFLYADEALGRWRHPLAGRTYPGNCLAAFRCDPGRRRWVSVPQRVS